MSDNDSIKREIRDHPERFDYSDYPLISDERRAKYKSQMDKTRPAFIKKLLADRENQK